MPFKDDGQLQKQQEKGVLTVYHSGWNEHRTQRYYVQKPS